MFELITGIYITIFALVVVNIVINKEGLSILARFQLVSCMLFSSVWYLLLNELKDINIPIGEILLALPAVGMVLYALKLSLPARVSNNVLNSEKYFKTAIEHHTEGRMTWLYDEKKHRKFLWVSSLFLLVCIIASIVIGYYNGNWVFYVSLVLIGLMCLNVLISITVPARSLFILIHYLNNVDKTMIQYERYKKIYNKVSMISLSVSDLELKLYNNNFVKTPQCKKIIWWKRKDAYKTNVLERIDILISFKQLVIEQGTLRRVSDQNTDT